jgi:uncharacterized glyoxalase superfamily protein PhnB
MKPPPKDYPRLTASVFYRDPLKMIDWLCAALGFEVRLKILGEAGELAYSELEFGGALVSVCGERDAAYRGWGVACQSPASLHGATSQSLMLFVDDVDVHSAQARLHGAVIVDAPTIHDYGDDYWVDRSYGCTDPEGHFWWLTQRIRG